MSNNTATKEQEDNQSVDIEQVKLLDSCYFGEITPADDADSKIPMITKGIKLFEKLTTECNNSPSEEAADNFKTLGHLHLLVEEYHKALSAYNKYYTICKEHWKDSAFLFGLGIVYYHFSAYHWTVKLFRQLLYNDPNFVKSNEVHCRLGLVFKATNHHQLAIKHFQLASTTASPVSSPKLKLVSTWVICTRSRVVT